MNAPVTARVTVAGIDTAHDLAAKEAMEKVGQRLFVLPPQRSDQRALETVEAPVPQRAALTRGIGRLCRALIESEDSFASARSVSSTGANSGTSKRASGRR